MRDLRGGLEIKRVAGDFKAALVGSSYHSNFKRWVYSLLTIALCTELVTLQALFAGLISIEARVT